MTKKHNSIRTSRNLKGKSMRITQDYLSSEINKDLYRRIKKENILWKYAKTREKRNRNETVSLGAESGWGADNMTSFHSDRLSYMGEKEV